MYYITKSLNTSITMKSERHTRDERLDLRIMLNNQARDLLLKALANPPQPAEALQQAAEKYAIR